MGLEELPGFVVALLGAGEVALLDEEIAELKAGDEIDAELAALKAKVARPAED